jgi:predicted dehydrogenase
VTELRWGILSTANIAREKVIPGILKADRCRIVAIGSRDAARAGEVARRYGIPHTHGSYAALLADPDVDAVYIPLPNHLHRPWAIAAARAGKHVLCEKPLAMTADDAQEMVDVAAASGVVLMEAFMYRHHPSWLAVREMVAAERIGPLTAVQTWFGYYNDDMTNIRNIREVGGGALFDIGCYAVNLSRLLFAGEPEQVAASITRDGADGVDVLVSAILQFAGGTSTFTCSIRTETDQRVHLYGPRGRITIEIPFNIPPDRPTRVFVTAGGDPPVAPATETLTFDTADPYTCEAEAFAASILDGTPAPTPPEDAVANLRVIERLFEAAEQRRTLPVAATVQPG